MVSDLGPSPRTPPSLSLTLCGGADPIVAAILNRRPIVTADIAGHAMGVRRLRQQQCLVRWTLIGLPSRSSLATTADAQRGTWG